VERKTEEEMSAIDIGIKSCKRCSGTAKGVVLIGENGTEKLEGIPLCASCLSAVRDFALDLTNDEVMQGHPNRTFLGDRTEIVWV
jgi:hypothetical protein